MKLKYNTNKDQFLSHLYDKLHYLTNCYPPPNAFIIYKLLILLLNHIQSNPYNPNIKRCFFTKINLSLSKNENKLTYRAKIANSNISIEFGRLFYDTQEITINKNRSTKNKRVTSFNKLIDYLRECAKAVNVRSNLPSIPSFLE